MQFRIEFQPEAERAFAELEQADPRKHKKVQKTLGLMQTDLRHPSLKTHAYDELIGPGKQKVFEAYVENKTPAAFRIFWYYGPGAGVLTILAITPHP